MISQIASVLHYKKKKKEILIIFHERRKQQSGRERPKNGTGFEAPPQEEAVKFDLDEGQFPNVNQTKEETILEFYTFLEISFGKLIISLVDSIKLCRIVSYFKNIFLHPCYQHVS